VVLHEGRVSLDRRYFWIDTWALEPLVAELEKSADPAEIARLGARLLALYRGAFLADEPDAPWLIAPRERLRNRFSRAIAHAQRELRSRGEAEQADSLHEKSLELL
jgi:two-component SAPR family response regulator